MMGTCVTLKPWDHLCTISLHLFYFQLCNILATWCASGPQSLVSSSVQWVQESWPYQFSREGKPDVCVKNSIWHLAETHCEFHNSEIWLQQGLSSVQSTKKLSSLFSLQQEVEPPTSLAEEKRSPATSELLCFPQAVLPWCVIIPLSTRCLILKENQLHGQPI